MKAIDFLKKFGLEHTKYLIEDTELTEFAIHSTCGGKYYQDTVSVSDLKQIVDAFDLVEKHGGLFQAKCQIENECPDFEFGELEYYEDGDIYFTKYADLEKSINLVEQCQ